MTDSETLHHARLARLEWLLFVLVLSVIAGFFAYDLSRDHTRIETREKERLSHQCTVVNMNLSRQFKTINSALAGILRQAPAWRKSKDGLAVASQHLKTLNDAMPGVYTFIVFNADGTVEASDKSELVGQNFSHRDYFQAVIKNPNPSTLYVRPPFITSRGNFTMNLARMIPGPQGEFAGVVVAALDAEEFKVLLDSVIYRPGIRAALIHGDGVPFLMAPNSKDVEGLDLVKPDSFFVQHLSSGRNANVFSGVFNYVGDERMVALQTVQDPSLSMDKPMVIVVDRRLQSMYASWKHEVFEYSLSIAILALLLAAALLLHQRQRGLAAHAKAQSEVERQTAVEALRQGEERFRSLIKLSTDWYWEQDEQFRFVRLSGDLDQKTRSANDAHVGKTRWEMGAVNLSEADWTAPRIKLQSHQEFHDFEMLRRNQDGSPRWTSVSGMPVFDTLGNFTGYRGVARDVTANKLSEEHIKHFAFYDGLTKLPNRHFLKNRLSLEFAASKRNQRYGALLFLDLDNFKPLNDKFGHEFGDLLLVEVADRLVACVREVDTVTRFGGDEFVLLLGNLSDTRDESMQQANQVAEKIRLSLAESYRLTVPQDAGSVATVEHRCTASIGVALFFDHEQSGEELLKQADMAMYQAKQAGRNTIRFYQAEAHD